MSTRRCPGDTKLPEEGPRRRSEMRGAAGASARHPRTKHPEPLPLSGAACASKRACTSRGECAVSKRRTGTRHFHRLRSESNNTRRRRRRGTFSRSAVAAAGATSRPPGQRRASSAGPSTEASGVVASHGPRTGQMRYHQGRRTQHRRWHLEEDQGRAADVAADSWKQRPHNQTPAPLAPWCCN
ncbi:unnamed protein product [Trichogramma brassicae]|uniref:Uncharacterized protein n=1 Tax=Trichogramma brassicae TaxID=86971 RepID=A0A6H5J0P0_9HYME|nr:unnamed protein product [Trichogramma brassicae]